MMTESRWGRFLSPLLYRETPGESPRFRMAAIWPHSDRSHSRGSHVIRRVSDLAPAKILPGPLPYTLAVLVLFVVICAACQPPMAPSPHPKVQPVPKPVR